MSLLRGFLSRKDILVPIWDCIETGMSLLPGLGSRRDIPVPIWDIETRRFLLREDIEI